MNDQRPDSEDLLQRIANIEALIEQRKTESRSKKKRFRLLPLFYYLLIVSLIMTPITLSKYISTVSGSTNTAIAGIDLQVSNHVHEYVLGSQTALNGHYAFLLDFEVSAAESDVAMSYSLSIKLSNNPGDSYSNASFPTMSSFAAPAAMSSAYTSDGTTRVTKTLSEISEGGISSVAAGELWFGFSEDNVTYTWQRASGTDNVITLASNRDMLLKDTAAEQVHYYRVLYFMDVPASANRLENTFIYYSINADQLD